jgi:DNA-binding NarL/FixJ family response regulator
MSFGDGDRPVAPVRVVVLAGVRLYREGLARILADRAELAVAGTAPVDTDGIERMCALGPDVILIEAAAAADPAIVRWLAARAPGARIVAYGVAEDTDQAVRCAEAGVDAYVPGEAVADDIVNTISALATGEFRCSPRVAAQLVRRLRALSREWRADDTDVHLTAREQGIAALLAEGLSNKEIGRRLGIELCTVKNHVHHILEKLHATSRAQAAARLRRGAIPPLVAARAATGS